MANTTVANVLAVAPDLASSYVPQVSAITITAANLKATATVDGVAYSANAAGATKTRTEIATELAQVINAALYTKLVAVAALEVVTLTALLPGYGFTAVGTLNCTVATSVVNSAVFELVLADVARQVSYDVYGPNQEEAQRYLAAHILVSMLPGDEGATSGAVKSEKVGGVSVSYSDSGNYVHADVTRYDTTVYGMRFQSILNHSVVPIAVY